MSGLFITFEGLDGSGKTTQLRMLENELKQRGHKVVSTCEPGGTLLGKRVREILLDDDMQVAPLAELLLFAADRAQHVSTFIRPALEKNQIVISDRFADATVAYQGAGRGFDAKIIEQLITFATDGLTPELTIFFDLPVEESLARTTRRAAQGYQKNRLDKETLEFHRRVRDAYLQIAAADSERFKIVNADTSVSEIQTQVLEIINPFLNQKNAASP